jgi:hypothetical protein
VSAPDQDLAAIMRDALATQASSPVPAAPPARTSSAKLNLATTIQSALTQQSGMRNPPAPVGARTRVIALGLFTVVTLGAAMALYFGGRSDTTPVRPAASAPAPALDRQQRAALDEILKSLHPLQSASSPSTSQSVYASRVTIAKSEADRLMGSIAPGSQQEVREIIDVHLLTVAAWNARTLDQRDTWEAVGQDAAVGLCPSVKRVVDFAGQPQGVSHAQARGTAVASAIPLLWECSAEKIAALERRLAAP